MEQLRSTSYCNGLLILEVELPSACCRPFASPHHLPPLPSSSPACPRRLPSTLYLSRLPSITSPSTPHLCRLKTESQEPPRLPKPPSPFLPTGFCIENPARCTTSNLNSGEGRGGCASGNLARGRGRGREGLPLTASAKSSEPASVGVQGNIRSW
jgi:hypothetical protein